MSLQTKLLILVTSLTFMLALAMVAREIEGARRSVREEIRTAHHVAEQLLRPLGAGPMNEAAKALASLGRIRAHDTLLQDATGRTLYRSPQSPYKAGRTVPPWFAAWVTPSVEARIFRLPDGGRLLLTADPSRAVIDGWDDFLGLVQWLAAGLCLLVLLCWRLVRHALSPLARIEAALRDVQQGRLDTRLPPLAGREAKLMGAAFNDMARGLQDTLAAREDARRAHLRLAAAQEMALAVQRRIEEERGHIARELHDEMGQQITAIHSFARVIANRAEAPSANLKDVARLLVDATGGLHDALRRIIPRLRPVALDRFGLRDALLDLIADFRLQAPALHLKVNVPTSLPALDDAFATALYRAAQEALTNVVKHAGATRVVVDLRVGADHIALLIEDDGHGLQPATPASEGFGLLGMRERIDTLNGSLLLEPARRAMDCNVHGDRHAPNDTKPGLRVAIRLPFKQAAA
jgi:two-component system sensor histidine kinase UhpB